MKIKKSADDSAYLPDGTYISRLKGTNEKTVSVSGKDTRACYFHWKVAEGPYADISFTTSFWPGNPSSMYVLEQAILAMGLNPKDIDDTEQMVGHSCKVAIEQTEPPFHKGVLYEAIPSERPLTESKGIQDDDAPTE